LVSRGSNKKRIRRNDRPEPQNHLFGGGNGSIGEKRYGRKTLWQKNRIAGRDMRSCHVNGPNSAAKKQQAKLAAILRFFGADRLAGA
jgi:hypothetical protein